MEQLMLWTSGRADRVRLSSLVAVTVIIAACGSESERNATAVRDSAGVRITITQDAIRTFAVIDEQPVLNLGGPDASGPTQFFQIQGIHVDARGNIWVADGGSAEVRLFRSDGSHWKTRGGRGEGPGEFMRVRLLGEFGGDSVAFWDHAIGRVTLFNSEGEPVRSAGAPTSDEAPPRASDTFSDGTLLAQITRILAARSLQPGQLISDTAHLVRVDISDMSRKTLGMAPGPTWVWTGSNQVPMPFTTNANFDLQGESVLVVAGPEFRIRVLGVGRVTEIFGVSRAVREADQAAVAIYTEFIEQSLTEPHRRDYLSVLDHEERPRVLPAYYRVLVADDGNAWAQVYSPDLFAAAAWDVFGSDRNWLGQVQTPAGFTVMKVIGDRLFGVWRDEIGVEYVRQYRLRTVGDPDASDR